MGVTETIVSAYKTVVDTGDPRTTHWTFVHTPIPSLVFVASYITFVKFGPKYFRTKAAASIRGIIVPYNIAMVLLSIYMFKEFLLSAYLANYNLQCEPMNYSQDPLALRIADVFWWFYISKIIELLDTVFLVARKKHNQLTFLHVFHHSTMIFNQWIGIKYVPGGHAFMHGMLNSFVHVIMYSYYGLACFPALKKFLWWKKYLTLLQLVQFVAIIAHVFVGLYNNCDFPRWPAHLVLCYCSTLIVLFTNFYIHAYRKRKEPAKNGYTYNITIGVSNSFDRNMAKAIKKEL